MSTLRTAIRVAYGAGVRGNGGDIPKGYPAVLRLLIALMLLLASALGAFAQGGPTTSAAAAVPKDFLHQAAQTIYQPWVTIGLLVAGCLLLFHDLLTPNTWGFTGNAGTICIGLVIASQVMVGDTGWVGVLLLLLGLALILLEFHVTPGYGVAIAGFILMFAGMFLSLGGTRNTAFALSVTSVLIVVSGLAFLGYLPKSPAWKRHIEKMRLSTSVVAADPAHFLGRSGTAITALRPNGLAEFEGTKVNVITEGDFLEAGERLTVTHVEGDRIVVHAVHAELTQPSHA